jgi:formylglycine-generating enzyme required for sulfatase activity
VAWWNENSNDETHSAGQKKPNAWGLYDMRGNVYEWVEDWEGPYAAERQVDPQGPQSGSARVMRGGSYIHSYADRFRCACRGYNFPTIGMNIYGFRCARTF